MGEGLAHFLKVQLRIAKGLPDDPCPFIIDWLNSQRKYYINIAPDDHNTFEVFSCTTLFIFYLHDQLGFSVESIIAAGVGASNLADVYKNLTGKTDGWTSFINIIDSHYPRNHGGPPLVYHPSGNNLLVRSISGYRLKQSRYRFHTNLSRCMRPTQERKLAPLSQ